jgi:MFS-type transporter involved in bile tolerance (Atg22 family)
MIWKMLVLDYIQNKRNLIIKFVFPLILFLPAYSFSEGNSILVLILIFTIMTGTGLKIAKLKSNSLYNRLIISARAPHHSGLNPF